MSFSTDMQQVVIDLLTELGNSCTLTKTTTGSYDPTSGSTFDTTTEYSTYSTSIKNASEIASLTGNINYNLTGFGDTVEMIPYQSGETVDTTWEFNGDPINKVQEIKSQNNIIAYILDIGTK